MHTYISTWFGIAPCFTDTHTHTQARGKHAKAVRRKVCVLERSAFQSFRFPDAMWEAHRPNQGGRRPDRPTLCPFSTGMRERAQARVQMLRFAAFGRTTPGSRADAAAGLDSTEMPKNRPRNAPGHSRAAAPGQHAATESPSAGLLLLQARFHPTPAGHKEEKHLPQTRPVTRIVRPTCPPSDADADAHTPALHGTTTTTLYYTTTLLGASPTLHRRSRPWPAAGSWD